MLPNSFKRTCNVTSNSKDCNAKRTQNFSFGDQAVSLTISFAGVRLMAYGMLLHLLGENVFQLLGTLSTCLSITFFSSFYLFFLFQI